MILTNQGEASIASDHTNLKSVKEKLLDSVISNFSTKNKKFKLAQVYLDLIVKSVTIYPQEYQPYTSLTLLTC